MTSKVIFKKHFYGQQISEEGLRNHRVDYHAFASAFEGVYTSDRIFEAFPDYWDCESGTYDFSDEIEELEEKIEELEDRLYEMIEADQDTTEIQTELDGMRANLEDMEDENGTEPEVFQWYIIDDSGADICKEFGEIVYYNSELDLYVWGVTHYGTSWDYVMTDIECNPDQD